MMPKLRISLVILASSIALSASAELLAQPFQYNPPGQLTAGSGSGRADDRVYVPGMRFPIEAAPAYANSQVWGHGGGQGPGGGQCDTNNYSYPWFDNYCESRSWNMPLCPSGTGHQGQDIRATSCENNLWWSVAAEDGTISSIGSYSVILMSDSGTRHRYLHMDPGSLAVSTGQRVSRGDRLGKVSNAFGGTPTTVHLHYDIQQNVSGQGTIYVPTYMSLVTSYEELIGEPARPCVEIGDDAIVLDNSGDCFQLFGPPASWREVTDAGNDGNLRWTNAWDNAEPGNWARWNLNFLRAGFYRVEVNVLPEYAASTRTPYTLKHGNEETNLTINQATGNGWIDLGQFPFAQGNNQWLAVYDNSGESLDDPKRIMADAVRITYIDPGGPDPDMGNPDPDLGPEDTGPEDLGPEDLGQPDTGTPDTGNPDTGNPDLGNTEPDMPPMDMGGNNNMPTQDLGNSNNNDNLRPDTNIPDGTPEPSTFTQRNDEGCATTGRGQTPGAGALLLLIGLFWLRKRA